MLVPRSTTFSGGNAGRRGMNDITVKRFGAYCAITERMWELALVSNGWVRLRPDAYAAEVAESDETEPACGTAIGRSSPRDSLEYLAVKLPGDRVSFTRAGTYE